MPTLSEILTKKDYTQKKPSRLFYKDSPAWQKLLTAGFIFLLTCSMMGDGKFIMDRLGALPKAITVGIICIHSKNPTCMHSIHVINIVLFLQSAVVDRDIITTFYQTG